VSAGIDVALTMVAEVWGAEIAQAIQLGIEYDPRPHSTPVRRAKQRRRFARASRRRWGVDHGRVTLTHVRA